jgi:hypothetical protein
MKELLIAVTAICLVGVLAEIMLCEGQTKKYIQGVLSLAIIFVLLSQLVTLIKENDILSQITIYEEDMSVDVTVLNNIELQRYDNAIITIKNNLSEEGISGVEITYTNGYDSNGNIFIQNIFVDINNAVIKENVGNINIIDKIITACQSEIEIEQDGIIINGEISI